jgi:hypothetical protein
VLRREVYPRRLVQKSARAWPKPCHKTPFGFTHIDGRFDGSVQTAGRNCPKVCKILESRYSQFVTTSLSLIVVGQPRGIWMVCSDAERSAAERL